MRLPPTPRLRRIGSRRKGQSQGQKGRKGRTGRRRWVPSWKLVSGLAVLTVGSVAGAFAVVYQMVDIPGENVDARRQATVYYWADGSRMVSVGDVNRQDVALDQVPDAVERAAVAAENADFYSDSGVSVTGIARAVVAMFKGGETQGGSTITQQYVKNTYLSQDQTVTRKGKEFVLALKVNSRMSKEDILQGYLNTSWFGRDSYGIQAASYAYYGIPADDLNPSQGAFLATLLKGADSYDPALGPANRERAVDRWEWVLDRQVETGVMSAQERATYKDFPEPKKPTKPTSQAGQIGYLMDITNKYLKSRIGLTGKELALGGYRIHTTFEKDKVDALAKAVEKVRAEKLDPAKREADRHVEVGAASVRPEDGAIVAVYGGSDAIKHFSNNADTSGVPVGSAFKPFVYAAALKRQGAFPAKAAEQRARAGTSLAVSLLKSENSLYVQTGKKLGLDKVRDTAIALGLRKESMAKLEPTFSIGTSTPSAVRMAGAYTTFVNDGERRDPYSVTKVERNGVALDGLDRPGTVRALDPEVAQVVSEALLGVGRDSIARHGKSWSDAFVRAAKTGVNDRMKSAWFIGTTPELSTAVTMFRTKPDTPQLLGMQGVGGGDSERGGVFPPLMWTYYQLAVAPDSLKKAWPSPVRPETASPGPVREAVTVPQPFETTS
ncbi:transglycosylase domain-containing protein [Streptomyces sp. NPDC088400]|uniref:transglycosylase domain-containing protein n=1 Tax=Streptomyces sp. NPDC088400 TaxID=3365861 RepID=UPI0037F26999